MPSLPQFLAGLVSGTFTVPAVGGFIVLVERYRGPLTKNAKRATALALSFLLGLGGFLGLIYLGYEMEPIGIEGWWDALLPIGTMAFTVSQIVLSGVRTWQARRK